MRHVSRTDRVDMDWLYDRINQERMIQIEYVNNTAIGRYSHNRIIHTRQMDTIFIFGERHDSHHIYSKQFVSCFCKCESFVFHHE